MKGLSSPHDVEAIPEGDIWLADAGNDRMLLLTPGLQIIKELSGSRYKFNGPRYQDIMPDGTLIAPDTMRQARGSLEDVVRSRASTSPMLIWRTTRCGPSADISGTSGPR